MEARQRPGQVRRKTVKKLASLGLAAVSLAASTLPLTAGSLSDSPPALTHTEAGQILDKMKCEQAKVIYVIRMTPMGSGDSASVMALCVRDGHSVLESHLFLYDQEIGWFYLEEHKNSTQPKIQMWSKSSGIPSFQERPDFGAFRPSHRANGEPYAPHLSWHDLSRDDCETRTRTSGLVIRESPHQNANLQLHFGPRKNEGMAEV